jgi:ATP-dependent Clp protease ATP-binding subunit ClpC
VAAELPPLFGRTRELARLADAVGRQRPRAPLLIGPVGSGRTSLVQQLAAVLDRPVVPLDATQYADDDALRTDLEAVAERGGIALLDDLDRVGGDAPPPCFTALVSGWASGTPPIVGVVTPEGRARLEAWAPALVALLDPIELDPLPEPDMHEAVRHAMARLLAQAQLDAASDVSADELVRLARRYLRGPALPGRAIDLVDLACARTLRQRHRGGEGRLTRSTLLDIVAERSGVPADRLDHAGDEELLALHELLARRVVGHDHALEAIAELLRRHRAGFAGARPVGSILLLGPSGVGKTEIAKALAEALFDRPDALVRIDMSEYGEAHAVARAVGAPPGYVGHEQGGAWTEPLLRQPHCVLLLDEIEKGHRDVHQLLLQVLDDGRLTDGRGRTVDFRHAVIVMTSNLGAQLGERGAADGAVLQAARAAFPVELWNRIEAPLVLRPLDRAARLEIGRRMARLSSARLHAERGVAFALSERALADLVDRAGDDPALGARPLRHAFAREVEALVADAVLRGRLRAGQHVLVDLRSGALALT